MVCDGSRARIALPWRVYVMTSLFDHIPGHATSRDARVVGGSDYPERTYYRDALSCSKCGWQGEDFGTAQSLLLSHLLHALSGVLSE